MSCISKLFYRGKSAEVGEHPDITNMLQVIRVIRSDCWKISCISKIFYRGKSAEVDEPPDLKNMLQVIRIRCPCVQKFFLTNCGEVGFKFSNITYV